MATVGVGVREIRVQHGGQSRVNYIARFAKAVYVLHAFHKKTQRTAQVEESTALSP